MNSLIRLGLLALVLTLPVVVHAGELPPASAFMLHAWLPEVAPDGPGEFDIQPLRQVARLARDGRFGPAKKLLAEYERSEKEPLRLYLAGLFRRHIRWLERGSFDGPMGDLGQAYGDLWVHTEGGRREVPPPSQKMEASALEDAQTAQKIGEALRGCAMLAGTILLINTSSEIIGANPQGQGPAVDVGSIQGICTEPLESISERYGQTVDVTLLNAFYTGRYPRAAEGDPSGNESAEQVLLTAIAAARAAGRNCATGHLLMRLGDLHAAPYGPVEMFGFSEKVEGTLRASAAANRLSSAVFPPPAEELASAERLYDEARTAFTACPAGTPLHAFAFRDALLTSRRGQPQEAAAKFQITAELASRQGALRIATMASAGRALAQNEPELLAQSFAEFIGRGDLSGAVSLSEVVLAECWRRWILEGDRAVIPLLSTAARTLERARLFRAAALISGFLGQVFEQLGRVERSVVSLEQSIHQQEEYITALERKGSGARDELERLQYQVEVEGERKVLSNHLLSLLAELEEMGGESSAVEQRSAELRRLLSKHLGSTEQGRALQPLIDLTLRSMEFSRKLVTVQTRTNCEELLAGLEALRPMAEELEQKLGNAYSLLLITAGAGCEPKHLEAARKRLASLDPVKPLKEALEGLRTNPGGLSQLVATQTIRNLELMISLSLFLEDHVRAKSWLDAMEAAIAAAPSLKKEEPFLRGSQALLTLRTGQPDRARELLLELLQRTSAASSVEEMGERLIWLQYLIEANAALGDDIGALLAWEQQRIEEERWEEARSGMTARWRASAELAMLERKQALHAKLLPSESARLQQLQQELTSLTAGPRDRAPTRADITSVLGRIPPGLVVLVYTAGHEPVVWRLEAPGKVQRIPLNLRLGELERLARALRERVAARQGIEEQARVLYDALLAPVGPLPKDSRLLILAPGELRSFPFEVLGPSGEAPLLRTHAIFYADHLLGPAPAPCDARPIRPVVVLGVNGTVLTRAEDEAREVAGLLRTTPLIGDKGATKEKVEAAIRGARLLHLATEATTARENVFASSLLLGRGEELETWWLLAKAPAAELVVLSACETRRQSPGGAEAREYGSNFVFQPGANRSLATIAHAVGARWVLASVWKVDDESTGELMTAFYRGLLAGAAPPEALQSAKRKLEGQGEVSPYYYAGFLLSARSLEAVLGSNNQLCVPHLEGAGP